MCFCNFTNKTKRPPTSGRFLQRSNTSSDRILLELNKGRRETSQFRRRRSQVTFLGRCISRARLSSSSCEMGSTRLRKAAFLYRMSLSEFPSRPRSCGGTDTHRPSVRNRRTGSRVCGRSQEALRSGGSDSDLLTLQVLDQLLLETLKPSALLSVQTTSTHETTSRFHQPAASLPLTRPRSLPNLRRPEATATLASCGR